MATATIYPTSGSSSNTSWSNTNQITAEDSTYASLSSTSRNTTYTLTATFGDTSSIPSGATINSITAYVKGYLSSNVTHTTTLGGNTITFTKTSNTTVSTSLSSTTIPSTVSFTIRKTKSTSMAVYVDCIWLVVDYTPAITRLFPYEINQELHASETSSSSNGVVIQYTYNSEEDSCMDYKIPVDNTTYSYYRISFDYEVSDTSANVRARVCDNTTFESLSETVYFTNSSGKATFTADVRSIASSPILFMTRCSGNATFTITNFTVEGITRLFPYEISYRSGNVTEVSTTSNGIVISKTSTENGEIDYELPIPSGKTYKISFDYINEYSNELLFSLWNWETNDNFGGFAWLSIANGSGHKEYILTNTSNKDIVDMCLSNTGGTGTFTITNFSLEEFKFMFDECWQAWTASDQTRYLSENSVTVSAQSNTPSGDCWEKDWYVPNLVDGKTYKITFDYTKTNDTSVDAYVITSGGVSIISNNTLTANSGSLTITFTASSDTLASDASYTNFYLFGVDSDTGINTITLSNITFEEVTIEFMFTHSWSDNSTYTVLDSDSIRVVGTYNETDDNTWESDWNLPILTIGNRYKLTCNYSCEETYTDVEMDITDSNGNKIVAYYCAVNNGTCTLEFMAKSSVMYFCIYCKNFKHANTITLSNVTFTETEVADPNKLISLKGNRAFAKKLNEPYFIKANIQNVVADIYDGGNAYIDQKGVLHCAYEFTDYRELVNSFNTIGTECFEYHWGYNNTWEIVNSNEFTSMINFVQGNEGYNSTEFKMNLERYYVYTFEFDYTNTTGNNLIIKIFEETGSERYTLELVNSTDSTGTVKFNMFHLRHKTLFEMIVQDVGSSTTGGVRITNFRITRNLGVLDSSTFVHGWEYRTEATLNGSSISYEITCSRWGKQFYLPVRVGCKYRLEYDLVNNTSNYIEASVSTDNDARYSYDYCASDKHVVHVFSPIETLTKFDLSCWDGNTDDTTVTGSVTINNLKLYKLDDNYNIGLLEYSACQGGALSSSGQTIVDDKKVVFELSSGSYFADSVDIDNINFTKDADYIVSMDYTLSHEYEDGTGWCQAYFTFWNSDTSTSDQITELTNDLIHMTGTRGHLEFRPTIPDANGLCYIKIEGGDSSYNTGTITLSNVEAVRQYFNTSLCESWWNSSSFTCQALGKYSAIYTYDSSVSATNNKENAIKISGFDTSKYYTFTADVEFITAEVSNYVSNYFKIIDGYEGSNTLSSEQFLIRNGQPLTQTKSVSYTFKPISDKIAFYCTAYHEDADINVNFTFKLSNMKIVEKIF